MKQVSDAYKLSMRSMLRNRSYVKVTFSNVDTTAATDGTWESNGAQSYSEFNTIDYKYDYEDAYATMELNRWALDGSQMILASSTGGTVQDGFTSTLVSDANGEFTTSATLKREFAAPHTLVGLTLTFDSRANEWPIEITVNFYLNGETVKSKVLKADDAKVVIDEHIASCDKIELIFGDMLPYRRPRLERVMYGVEKTYMNSDIISTKQSHDVDPLTRRLPKETMQFKILDYEHNYDPDNPTGIYSYVDKNSPVSISFGYELPNGEIEWVKDDKYVLNSKPSVAKSQATFSGTGLIGSLTGSFYKSKLGEKNFYDMAEEVLLDANLMLTERGENPWVIDPALKQMKTTAALPIDTHMNCLQLIAHACRSRLFTDDDNVIHIKPFGVTISGIYRGTWSDNGHMWLSEWDSVDKGNKNDSTYITLELNRWALNGSDAQQILEDEDSAAGKGFISQSMTDGNGDYSTAPVFTKVFDVSHDLPILTFDFDSPVSECPSSIQVKYYNGNTLLDTQTVTGITSSRFSVNSSLAIDCTKFEVTVLSGLPYRRARVSKVYYRETDYTLDFTTISEDSQTLSKIDQLKNVTVAKYAYTASDSDSTLYEGTTAETELHVEFSDLATDVQIAVTGGTLVSSDIYARAADLVLSSGTKTVTITGKTLSENSVVVSYPVNLDGETDEEKNSLITNDEMSVALAEHVKKYLQMRNTYDVTYRGNPELEVGDIIGLQTKYTDELDALVLVDEITFNGSLSGKVKVKALI